MNLSTQPDPVEGWSFVPKGFVVPHPSYHRSSDDTTMSLAGDSLFVGSESEPPRMHRVPLAVLAALLPTQQFQLVPVAKVEPPAWFVDLGSRPLHGWHPDGTGGWEVQTCSVAIDIDRRQAAYLTVRPPVGEAVAHLPMPVIAAVLDGHGVTLLGKAEITALREDLRDARLHAQKEHMRADENWLDLQGQVRTACVAQRDDIARYLELVAATLAGDAEAALRNCAARVRDESYVARLPEDTSLGV